MRVIGVMLDQIGSSRFPGKSLAPIIGMPMVEHVYRRTVITSPVYERASGRVAEVLETAEADVVVMVQGGEPMAHHKMVEDALAPFFNETGVTCVNLIQRIDTRKEFEDPKPMKVVMGKGGTALCCSRQPIPFQRDWALGGYSRSSRCVSSRSGESRSWSSPGWNRRPSRSPSQ